MMAGFPTKNEMRRAFLGHHVAHMTDEQLDSFVKPYEELADLIIERALDHSAPVWWLKLKTEQGRLLCLLRDRIEQLNGRTAAP